MEDHVEHDCGPDFSEGHPERPRAAERRGHDHGHDHGASGAKAGATGTARHRRRLVIVLAITLAVFVVQVVGALVSGSLSLLADAGHMLTDATGVAIALIASLIAGLPASSKRTFGYLRVEVLAALANGIVLGVIAVVILVQAIARFGSEVEVLSGPMLIAAVIGAVANLVSLLILRSGQRESLNVRGAYLEVLGDLLGSLAVIAAGLVILLTGWNAADQLASIAIALMIVPRAVSLLREVVDVLLEASPRNLDVDAVRDHMRTVPGVAEVHDVHAWTITSGVPAFSAHVTVTTSAMWAIGEVVARPASSVRSAMP
ncbi:cation diffusion facilitator family transporter [Leucobacter massiliensis]|uniref:cation diffusion facilitator family transporter n=1 Tax=Leucobacter massiliensis TaxID=1686285 RepID=UPI003CCC3739